MIESGEAERLIIEVEIAGNSSGQGYSEMGKVYKDFVTGKSIMVGGG